MLTVMDPGRRDRFLRRLAGLDVAGVTFDVGLAAAAVATLADLESVVAWFHVVFLLLCVHAFRVTGWRFVLRALPGGVVAGIALLWAYDRGIVPVDELVEYPILASVVVVVYLVSARHLRLVRAIEGQRRAITELHQAGQRELQEQLALAQQLEANQRLAAAVVHDVNNVLGAIRVLGENLADGAPGTDPRRAGAEIETYAERAGLIIADLLRSSRLTADARRRPVCDLATTVADAAPVLRRLCGESVDLEIDAGDARGLVPLAQVRLEQMLVNLVANAVEACEPGGRVRVGVHPDGDTVVIRIADDGRGIPDHLQERIFEPYFTTRADAGGTGLGLYTVREQLLEVGGSVRVDSTPGEGALVEMRLPFRPSASRPEGAATAHAAAGAAGDDDVTGAFEPLDVVFVDDDPVLLDHVTAGLRAAGHTVHAFADAESALAHLRHDGACDVVVTDLTLPGMSGLELADRLGRRRRHLPVLVASGSAESVADLPRDVRLRRKPYTVAQLLADLVSLTRPT